jgi:tetratricopeptide (TPR) repeat protein
MLNWGDIEDQIPEKWRNKVLALLAVILLAALLVGLANGIKSLIGSDTKHPSVGRMIDAIHAEGHLNDGDLQLIVEVLSRRTGNENNTPEEAENHRKALAQVVTETVDAKDKTTGAALALIAEGRVEEGLSLLESEAETDSEQAARRWRELGVLLSNRSVLRAIAAYEKSLASNPEQFSVNIALIRLYQTSGDLEQAQRQIAAADMNRTTRREHSVLLDEKGDVKRASGDSQGALADYREGLKIRRALAQDDPANAEHRRDLSVSLSKIGDVKRASGDSQGALADYRESLKIRRALAQDDPANAEHRRGLSVSLEKIGDVHQQLGNFSEALAFYRKSLPLAKQLAQTDPDSVRFQQDLKITEGRISELESLSNQ